MRVVRHNGRRRKLEEVWVELPRCTDPDCGSPRLRVERSGWAEDDAYLERWCVCRACGRRFKVIGS